MSLFFQRLLVVDGDGAGFALAQRGAGAAPGAAADGETIERSRSTIAGFAASLVATLAAKDCAARGVWSGEAAASTLSGVACGAADGPPTWLGVALGDICSGIMAAHGILLALLARATTGQGQYVDVAMYDTMVALAERSVTAYSLTNTVLSRGREPFMAPWGPFAVRDGYVALVVPTEADWAKFCRAIGRDDLLENAELSSGPGRARMPTWITPTFSSEYQPWRPWRPWRRRVFWGRRCQSRPHWQTPGAAGLCSCRA